MGRCRLRLEAVSGTPKARKRAYETRKKGVQMKAAQLSTLCGVDVCLITYPPPLKNHEEIPPFLWSNDPAKVANLVESYQLGGECSKSRTCDLAWFYEDRTKKVQEETEKVKKAIRQVKYPNWDEQYFGSLSSEELRMFARVLTAKVESAKETIKLLKESSGFLMNIPRIDQNPDSSLGTRLDEQHLVDAQSNNYYLENERRMMMMNMMNINGSNLYTAPLMSFDDHMQNVGDYSVAGVFGQDQLMMNYFPQMFSGFHPNMGF